MSLRRKAAPAGKPLHRCAPIFAALGDEMRLRLIAALCVGGAMSITQLTSGTDITRQAITKHLDELAAAGPCAHAKVPRGRLREVGPRPPRRGGPPCEKRRRNPRLCAR